jgi:hypothetical protein
MNPPNGSRDEFTSSINLTWEESENPRNGGTPITSYHIDYRYDTDPEDQWQELVGFSSSQVGNNAQHSNVRPDSIINYRIRAKNRWGWGPYSFPDLVMTSAS